MPERPLVFLSVIALLTISPGVDMAVVARSALTGGRGAAFATTLGVMAGLVVWAVASALGVAALLAASQVAYDTLRLAGAAYLVWLGVQSLLAARRGEHQPLAVAGSRSSSPFRQGLLTNLFNPKIAVFYSTFLPQFIAPGDPVLLMSLALAGVHILMGLVWLSAYAWALDRAAARFQRLAAAADARCRDRHRAHGAGARLALERR